MLLHFPEFYQSQAGVEQDMRQSVDYMLSLLQATGNVPPAMDEVQGRQKRPESEELVHWCHGGPGTYMCMVETWD